MLKQMQDVLGIIESLEKVFHSQAEWEFKYDVIFGSYQKGLRPRLEELGLDLEWYDPDTTYEEDVCAFMRATEELKRNIRAVLHPESAQEPPDDWEQTMYDSERDFCRSGN